MRKGKCIIREVKMTSKGSSKAKEQGKRAQMLALTSQLLSRTCTWEPGEHYISTETSIAKSVQELVPRMES